jgi:hypothetical protein
MVVKLFSILSGGGLNGASILEITEMFDERNDLLVLKFGFIIFLLLTGFVEDDDDDNDFIFLLPV